MKKYSPFIILCFIFCCREEFRRPDGDENLTTEETCDLIPVTPVDGKYADCLPVLSAETIDIITWNAENFPKASAETLSLMKEIIQTLDPDVIAFQEISSLTDFTQLIHSLGGWSALTGSGPLRLAFAYKASEISVVHSSEIFPTDESAFPRAPLAMVARHISGKELTLINLHLKCCDDGNSIQRRKDASAKIKNYLNEELSEASVIVLGDMNEDITQPDGNEVFTNFVNDNKNYRFADMAIANCSESRWSFPDWPSHIDHMLVTNELFLNVMDTRTLTLRDCEPNFQQFVTDHHPVLLRLTAE